VQYHGHSHRLVTGVSRQLVCSYGTTCGSRSDSKTLLLNIINSYLRRFCTFSLWHIVTYLLYCASYKHLYSLTYAIWHVYLWGPMIHCARPPGEGEIWGVEPPAKTCNCKLLLPSGKYMVGFNNSIFYQITLILVCVYIMCAVTFCKS